MVFADLPRGIPDECAAQGVVDCPARRLQVRLLESGVLELWESDGRGCKSTVLNLVEAKAIAHGLLEGLNFEVCS